LLQNAAGRTAEKMAGVILAALAAVAMLAA
jgi:hypothetical protein